MYYHILLLLLELAEGYAGSGLGERGNVGVERCMCRIQRDETREAILVWALAGQRQEAWRSSMWRVLGQH